MTKRENYSRFVFPVYFGCTPLLAENTVSRRSILAEGGGAQSQRKPLGEKGILLFVLRGACFGSQGTKDTVLHFLRVTKGI